MIQKNANTTCSETEEYITTRVLKKTKLAKPFALIEPAVSIDVPPLNSQQEEDKEESEDDLRVLSLSNLSQNEAIKRNSENDGLEYLAGYIAKKFKNTHNLGYCTYKNTNEHCYAIPNWLQHLSFGGLIQPSKQWMKQVHIMEKKFNQFHGKTSIKSGQNIVKRTTNFLANTLNISKELIEDFSRQRIFVRIKYLNTKSTSSVKRKLVSKYRKIIS